MKLYRIRAFLSVLGVSALSVGIYLPSFAASTVWNGTTTSWGSSLNWSGGIPTASDVATFNTLITGSTIADLGRSTYSVGGLSFLSGSPSMTISNGTLSLGRAGISNSAARGTTQNITANLSLTTNTTMTTSALGATTQLSGLVNLANSDLTLTGNGKTRITGTASSGGTLYVALSSSSKGNLEISNGGSVSNTLAYVGYDSGSVGTATVNGVGSQWTNSDYLYVGDLGQGTLNITNGGTVVNTGGNIGDKNAYLGYGVGSIGTVTVDGSGSEWTNGSILYLGVKGQGVLNITNGGAVSNTVVYIGFDPGSVGTATVDGSGSKWTSSNHLDVGLFGQGTVNISKGGVVSDTIGTIGSNSDSIGTVTVDGSGSQWSNTNDLIVGSSGQGTLNITNGGIVSNSFGHIGYRSGAVGTVTVDGVGSQWASDRTLSIGEYAPGTLNITNGGAVSNTAGYIGDAAGSVGTVTVDGLGSQWHHSSGFYVGKSGQGALTITHGGVVVANAEGYIGYDSGSMGIATVDGSGSRWTSGADLSVGSFGTGTLNITNGGAVFGSYAHIGYNSGSVGTVTVDGVGSQWTNNANITVGYSGQGTLNITNGGVVSNTLVYIGYGSGSAGTVTVDGLGSEWTNNDHLIVGNLGQGTLRVKNGGIVRVGSLVGSGTIELSNADAATPALTFGSDSTNSTFSGGISDSTTGAGGIRKVGSGTQTLTGSNTFTGGTYVDAGTLTLSGTDQSHFFSVQSGATLNNNTGQALSITSNSSISSGTVSGDVKVTGGTLTNNGTISGLTTIQRATVKGAGNYAGGYILNNTGTILFGNSPGTLQAGSSTWNPGSKVRFQIDNANGVAGTNWGLNAITGTLSINSGATPITVTLESLLLGSGNTAGTLTGFDGSKNYFWNMVQTTGGITGFDSGAFFLDLSSFQLLNPTATGTFSLAQSRNNLQVRYSAAVVPEGSTGLLALLGVSVFALLYPRRK